MNEKEMAKRQAEIKLRDKIETALRSLGDNTEYEVDITINSSYRYPDGRLDMRVTIIASAREQPDYPTDPRADAVLAGWPTEL